jgi:hypothetical protein
MKLTVRKIGNSFGVIIPKVFLAGLSSGDDIEVSFGPSAASPAPQPVPEKPVIEEKLRTPMVITSKDVIRDMQLKKGVNPDYDWEKGYKEKEISIE